MHSIRAVQDGFARWSSALIDRAPVDLKKKLAAALGVVNFRLPVIIANLNRIPAVAVMGFVSEDGSVDVEGLRGVGQILARGGLLSLKLPMVGSFEFTEADVAELCNAITGEGGTSI